MAYRQHQVHCTGIENVEQSFLERLDADFIEDGSGAAVAVTLCHRHNSKPVWYLERLTA